MDKMLADARNALTSHLNTPASSDDAAAWIAAREILAAIVRGHEARAARRPLAPEARAMARFRSITARGLRP